MKVMVITLMLFYAVSSSGKIISAQQENAWTLEKCIQYALKQNIQVRKTILSIETTILYAEQARAQRFPSLGASVYQNYSLGRNSSPAEPGFTGSNGTSYSVTSGMTLFNYSRINNLIRQAELEIQGGNYSLETVKESLSLNILKAFLQVLYADELVKNSRKQIESTQGQLFLAGERLALKGISQAEYAQVNSQLASEKLNLASAESQLAIARVNLMQLLELPVTESFDISRPDLGENINQNRIPDVKTVFETALAVKPQIKNAAINKEIASLDEDIARAGYYPVLSANAGITSAFSSQLEEPYFNQVNHGIRPGIGFSLAIPIYQKKQVRTNIAVSKINYLDAGLNETNTRNQLRKDIEQACQDVLSAQIEYEASLQKYDASTESSLLSDEKFKQGLINSVDYLVQKTNLVIAESQLLQSKYNLIFSYKIMDFYMGVPFAL
jgi:outer membrane protein